MKRKDLLELDPLGVTDGIWELAYADRGEIRKTEQRWYGDHYTQYKIHSYLRAGVLNGILKIEIYRGEDLRNSNEEPAYILFLSAKEHKYATYLPKEGKWSSAKLQNLSMGAYDFTKRYENTFWISEKDQEIVMRYLDSKKYTVEGAVNEWQTTAMHRKEIQEIDRVMDRVSQSPADFGRWVQEEVFWRKQYFFYNAKKGEAYCTACRKLIKTRIKSVHNQRIYCPECGRAVTGKSWNKQKEIHDYGRAALIQRIQGGYMIRSFYCRKVHKQENGWQERLSLSEDSRQLRDKDMRNIRDYDYTNFKQSGKIRWCRSQYINHNSRAVVYHRNLASLRCGIPSLRDVPLEKILAQSPGCPVYLEHLLRPQKVTGYLANAGLTRLTLDYMDSYGYVKRSGKNAAEVLGINSDRIGRLRQMNGGMRILGWLQYEQKTGKKLRQDLLIRLDEEKISLETLQGILKYGITPERALNYLGKQKNQEKALIEWKDYLEMAEKERLNLQDDIVRFPRDLKARHDELTELANTRKEQERLKGYRKLDKKIRSRIREAARYYWQDKEYMIVPAAKCEELMREGRTLHHCVGASDLYMNRMAAGESWILFLRKKEDPEKPYYTIEIEMKTDRIRQWYSEYDRQPDREKIEKVLKRFKKSLKPQNMQKMRVGISA